MQKQQRKKEIGPMPPHSSEIEESVLGILISLEDSYQSVSDLLHKDLFYEHKNAYLLSALQSLNASKMSINLATIVNKLIEINKLDEAGGPHYVSSICTKISSYSMLETYIKILIEKYIRREVIKMSHASMLESYDESLDVFEHVENMQSKLMKLSCKHVVSRETSITDAMLKVVESDGGKDSPSYYIKTHLDKLNGLTNGVGGGNLIVLAGRPAHGKSAIGVDIIREIAKNGTPAGIFSAEMMAHELGARNIAAETDISTLRLRTPEQVSAEEWVRIKGVIEAYNDIDIRIDDSKISIDSLKAKIRRMHASGVKVFMIDYLQRIKGDKALLHNESRYYGYISFQLKELAMELDVPIILLSQLNRDIEKRGKIKKPVLSDLRSSGDIEQDADTVIFIVNPAVDNIPEITINETLYNVEDKVLLSVAKCRHGKIGSFLVGISKSRMKYYDVMDEGYSKIQESSDSQPKEDLPF